MILRLTGTTTYRDAFLLLTDNLLLNLIPCSPIFPAVVFLLLLWR